MPYVFQLETTLSMGPGTLFESIIERRKLYQKQNNLLFVCCILNHRYYILYQKYFEFGKRLTQHVNKDLSFNMLSGPGTLFRIVGHENVGTRDPIRMYRGG